MALSRRDRGPKEKDFVPVDEAVSGIVEILQDIQDGLLAKATEFREEHTVEIDDMEEFRTFFTPKNAAKEEPGHRRSYHGSQRA